MKMDLNAAEGRVLHGLLSEAAGDTVVKLDSDGFILHASSNIEAIGTDLSAMLLPPHVTDMADREFSVDLEHYLTRVMRGEALTCELAEGLEFPLRRNHVEHDFGMPDTPRWYTLILRRVPKSEGGQTAAVGLLRSVARERELQLALDQRVMTDPLTGLANEGVFNANLRRQIASGEPAMMAIFGIDRLRAIFMQYGQRTADEVCWGFARFFEAMTLPENALARLDNERFGVILPGQSAREARQWVEGVLETVSALTYVSSPKSHKLTASAGIAPVERSSDWTLRQAEIALVMARASGGMQVGQCGNPASGSLRFASDLPEIPTLN